MDVPEPNALDDIDKKLELSSRHTTHHDTIRELSRTHDITAQSQEGLTRLHYAVLIGDYTIVRLMLDQSEVTKIINLQDLGGHTPLHLLLSRPPITGFTAEKMLALCSLFLEKGADPAICAKRGGNALHYTVATQSTDRDFRAARPELLKLFVSHGVPIDSQNSLGETALHFLYKLADITNPNLRTRMELLPTLLALSANPNARNHVGETPLHYAVINLLCDHIAPLVAGGVSVHEVTNLGDTPLHYVFKTHNRDADNYFARLAYAPTLLELGANPNAQNKMGITPFYSFMSKPCGEQTNALGYAMLTTYGANPNIRTKEGFTPLHAAVGGRHVKWVKLLLAHPATDTSLVHAPTLLRAQALTGGKTAFDLALEMMLMPPPQGRCETDTIKLDNLNENGDNNIKAIFTLLLKDLFKRAIEKVNSSSNVDAM